MILVFTSTQNALRAEDALLDEGLDVDVIPKPPALTGLCGIALEVGEESASAAAQTLEAQEIPFEIYDEDWEP